MSTTFDESRVRRVQQGVSTGGQFTAQPRSETGVSLAGDTITRHDHQRFFTPAGQAELAVALHEKTGWEIVGSDGGTSTYLAVRSPNGRILSLAGVVSEHTWLRRVHSIDTVGSAARTLDVTQARAHLDAERNGSVGLRAREVADILVGSNEAALTDLEPPIDETDEGTYTRALCYQLAHELHQATGWPIVVVGDGPGGVTGWVHAGVQRPDGAIVDVRGVHEDQGWVDEWAEMVDSYGEDEEDYDGDRVWVYRLDEVGGTDQLPADPYEGIAQSDRDRTRQVAQLLLAEHA
ncbi:hypothetical protein [Pseudactinotalea terrae]|uniref:hypothetical protein n=1 Tax=Pseudactinotalea terrae TaxID=1743262 RepID=UPI0012E1F3A4|nr:hypothetical protein [Pseudactinotalea terrae]